MLFELFAFDFNQISVLSLKNFRKQLCENNFLLLFKKKKSIFFNVFYLYQIFYLSFKIIWNIEKSILGEGGGKFGGLCGDKVKLAAQI